MGVGTTAQMRSLVRIALPRSPAIPAILSSSAALMWALSIRRVDPTEMTDIGLVSALSTWTFVALAIHTAGFMTALFWARLSTPVLFLQTVSWIFMLHGFNALIAVEPVFEVAWRHAGIADYVLANRTVDPNLDAYFSWPGFFSLSALVTQIADLSGPVALIRWAPPFFNLLYLAPLAYLFRSVADNPRVLWLGLWLFYTANWISQDYLSPQAFAYFAYLLILAILLDWFVSRQASLRLLNTRLLRLLPGSQSAGAAEVPNTWIRPPRKPSYRLGAMVLLIGSFAAIVPSHQLTPFAVLAAVTLLVITRQLPRPGLAVLMGVMLATWIGYMTINYLSGHFSSAFNLIGPGESATVNVQGRLQGTPEHLIVVRVRVAMALLLWVLAVSGAIRSAYRFHNWVALAVLFAAPFPLLVLQPYGGEMLLRVYLLALPISALFAAGLLAPANATRTPVGGPARPALVAVLCLGLVAGFLVARYGNQTIDMFTSEEIDGVVHLYRIAPEGSYLLAAEANLPWKYQEYGTYRYETLRDHELDFTAPSQMATGLATILQTQPAPARFFVVTRGQKEAISLLGVPAPTNGAQPQLEPGRTWLDALEAALEQSARFRIVFANRDATIFLLDG